MRRGSWREESSALVERLGGNREWVAEEGVVVGKVVDERSRRGVEERIEMEAREVREIHCVNDAPLGVHIVSFRVFVFHTPYVQCVPGMLCVCLHSSRPLYAFVRGA